MATPCSTCDGERVIKISDPITFMGYRWEKCPDCIRQSTEEDAETMDCIYCGNTRYATPGPFEDSAPCPVCNPDGKLPFNISPGSGPHADNTPALFAVIDERVRQVEEEGFTFADDDRYRKGELLRASMCLSAYALMLDAPDYILDTEHSRKREKLSEMIRYLQPGWGHEFLQKSDRRGTLVKAAALLLAEIERMDRGAWNDSNDTGRKND